MTHAEDIARHGTAICIAALGFGGATGALAIGATILATVGFHTFASTSKVCEAAAKQVLRDMQASGALDPEALAKAHELLVNGTTTVTVDRVDLPAAAQRQDFYSAVVDQLMRSFPDDADPDAISLIRIVMGHAFTACRHEDAFHRPMEQALLTSIMFDTTALKAGQEKTDGKIDAVQAKLDRMERLLLQQSQPTAKRLHIQEGLLIALARRYGEGNPDDFDGALAGLQRALETAAEEREKGRLPGNVDAAVNAVLARVDELNDEGRIDEAEAALLDEMARAEAAQMRLIDKGLAQVVLTRNVPLAVDLELKKLALDGDGFDALRAVRREWYERGRDKGLAFDLEVAIALARASVGRAGDADQRGAALNDHGIALQTLGARESGVAQLQAAVAAYESALLEYTRDRVPLGWAMTQNNLGNALRTLGERESGVAQLQAAVAAYESALLERTRERVPLDWAMTQNNLGNALKTLGARESGVARLQAAVAAYERALLEYTRDRVPLGWAMTQNNLGTALRTLGERESGVARLQAAVAAYESALLEYTRDRVPLDWAMTQNNLGAALRTLGERESGVARLQAAVAAYERALLEYTRDRVPLGWAMTQENLALVELSIAQKCDGAKEVAHARAALAHVEAALEVFDPQESAFNHQKASRLRDALRAALAG